MTKILIIGAVLDKERLELYKEDGSSIILEQGNPNLQKIIEMILPVLQGHPVSVDMSLIHHEENIYRDVEKRTNGVIKFFRAAKHKIAKAFGLDSEVQDTEPTTGNAVVDKAARILKEIDAEPVSITSTSKLPESEMTMVAQVGTQVIPHMELLSTHFIHLMQNMGSTQGITNFLTRLGAMQEKRGHTVEELLQFLKRADLPIAEDGSIIIYKGLDEKDSSLESTTGRFVDPHSKKVVQDEGDYVHMDEALVDPSRSTECAQGLHVACKGYLQHFRTGVVMLAKVNPEDVIAVPLNEPTKMRVKGYHILFQLTHDGAALVKKGGSIALDTASGIMLEKAITGKHSAISRYVKIGGPRGTLVTHECVKPLHKGFPETDDLNTEPCIDVEIDESVYQTNMNAKITTVDTEATKAKSAPSVEVSSVTNLITESKVVKKMTKTEELLKCIELYKAETDRDSKRNLLMNVMALKRTAKKSWDFLGVSKADAKRITDAAKLNKL